MKKFLSVSLALTTIVWLSGIAMLVPYGAQALTINEGDIIRGPDGIRVYIVNANGYKRHIFNPAVFNMYGHLKWSNIKEVSQATLDSYITSDLYRADVDPKVYSLTEIDRAAGLATKHWIDMTPAQFEAKGYKWGQVFIVNEKERDYYQTGASITDGVVPPPVAGTLSVTDQIGVTSMVVPLKAGGVEVLKFKLTAGAAMTINSIKLTRKGVGSYADIEYLYIYEGSDRLTNGKSISSDSDSATFSNLNIALAAGQSKILTVKADMDASGSGNGNKDYIELANITTSSGTVSGVPLSGPMINIAASTVALVTISVGSTVGNPTIGGTQVTVSKPKLGTISNEKIKFHQLMLTQTGSVSLGNIANWKLYYGNDVLANGVVSGDTLKFILDTPYLIDKGGERIFEVKGDLTASNKASQTLELYLEETTDLLCIGQSYGYGAYVTNSFASSDTTALTLQGGDITVAFLGPTSATVAKGGQDVNLFEFSVSSVQNVTVKNLYANIYHSSDITHAYSNNYLTDIKVVDKDTGNTVLGPVDISSFTDGGGAYATYTFTEDFDMNAGQTRNFKVTTDIHSSITAGTYYFKLGSVASSYIFSSTDVKSRDASGEYITSIVPSTPIQGNNMSIASASLTLSLASTPVTGTWVKGAQKVESLGILLKAGDGSDAKVTRIKLSAYVDESTSGTFTLDTDATVIAKDMVGAVYLYDDAGALIAGPKAIDNDGYVEFSSLSSVIPKGTTKKIIVKADLANVTPNGGTSDRFKFDVAVAADIDTQDESGTAIAESGHAFNGTTTDAGTRITIASAGSLYVYPASDRPVSAIVVAGTNDVVFSKFKFTGVNEAFTVKKLTFDNASATYDDAIVQVKVQYKNQAGTTVTKTGSLSSGETTVSGLDFYVPKDADAYLTVYANLATIDQTTSGDAPALHLSKDTTNDDEFEAVGVSSGTTIDDDDPYFDGDQADAQVAGNIMYVRKAKPTISNPTVAPTTFNNGTNQTLYRFRVSATGGAVDLYELDFNVTTSGSVQLSSYDIYNITEGTGANWSCSIATNTVTCTASSGDAIASGGYEDFKLTATSASADIDDYVATYLITTDISTGAVANAAAGSVASSPNIVWSDESATPHSTTSSDWTNGYLVKDDDAYGASQTTYFPITS